MQRRHAPLFELDEHNNYRAIPFTDPIYTTPTHHHHAQHTTLSTPHELPTGLQLLLADLHKLSFRAISDWVLKPFISGLAFGMGSYASRYIVHALMVRYSDYHVPADMGGGGGAVSGGEGGVVGGEKGAGGGGAGGGAAAAVDSTPSVVAETMAHQMGEQISGGSQSLATTASHHLHRS